MYTHAIHILRLYDICIYIYTLTFENLKKCRVCVETLGLHTNSLQTSGFPAKPRVLLDFKVQRAL